MPGFPARPSLGAFGPTLVNRSKVVDPRKDVGADLLNLIRWQTAGLSQVSPQAWLLATFTPPTTVAITAQGTAWQGASPNLQRKDTGLYVVTYPPTNADETTTPVQTSLLAALVVPRANTPRLRADWDITNGTIVTLTLFDRTDTPTDGSFLMVAF